jgi:hypothetical protein
MSRLTSWFVILTLPLVAACATQATEGTDQQSPGDIITGDAPLPPPDTRVDGAADLPDAGADQSDASSDLADTMPDSAVDSTPDSATDTTPDTLADTAADTAADTDVQPEPKPLLGWVPLVEGALPGAAPAITMKESTTKGALVNFEVPGFTASEVELDGQLFHHLDIPGFGNSGEEGQPELPVLGSLVEVPFNVTIKPTIYKSDCIFLGHYRVAPTQPPRVRADTQPDYNDPSYLPADYEEISPLVLDQEAYAADAQTPAALTSIEPGDVGVLRGHRLLVLRANPLRYNPATRVLEACSVIEIRLEFDKSALVQPPPLRLRNDDLETALDLSLLNYFDAARLGDDLAPPNQTFGCDYLILTHGDFYDPQDADNPVLRLADWKRHKGLRTMIVDIADIAENPTEADIADYIKTAYEEWGIPPSYILLVGDSEFIPTHHVTDHPSHTPDLIGSDSRYVTVDGSDYFPDIYLGRLSVDTVQQASALVDKIIAYEQTPPLADAFYNTHPLVNLFEDARPDPGAPGGANQGNGQEDRSFLIIEFAQEVRTFLTGLDRTVNAIWAFSGQYRWGPMWYQDGTFVPVELTVAGGPPDVPGFPWDGDKAKVLAALNAGAAVVSYNAHGGRQLWGQPRLETTDVTDGSLVSPGPVSVYLSYACQTGWFDNETDNALDTSVQAGAQPTDVAAESLLEQLTRLPKAGAAGAIGATRNSWAENDFMYLGAYKGLYPGFIPAPTGAGDLPEMDLPPVRRLDPLNLFAKIYMAQRLGDSDTRSRTFEMYLALGDPEMTIWADKPLELVVQHPACVGSTGTQDFLVLVKDQASGEPLRAARVAVTDATSILVVGTTDHKGQARLHLHTPAPGTLDLTVSHLLYRPYLGKLKVSEGGAHFSVLSPGSAIQGQQVSVAGAGFLGNEQVTLTLGATVLPAATASNGQFGVGTPKTFNVPAPFDLGLHNLTALGQDSQRCASEVLEVRPDTTIDLYTYAATDSSTWHLLRGDNPSWNSPSISLFDPDGNPVGSNNLEPGITYTVKVRVFNDSDVEAPGALVAIAWADFGVGQPDKLWEDAGLSDPGLIPARGSAQLEVPWTPIKTGHICLRANVIHDADVDLQNNVGQENCHVGRTASPAEAEFLLWNPTDHPAMVFLELRQLGRFGFADGPLWGSAIVQPDPQLLLPGESRPAKVIIDPAQADGDVPEGTQVEFALTGYINGHPIGGANFAINKGPCPDGGCLAGCVPDCVLKACGWDGCDRDCGQCNQGQWCNAGVCEVPPPVELCPQNQHDGGLGDCLSLSQCTAGFKLALDGTCKLEPFHLPFLGTTATKEGVAAWWADGTGVEPAGDGHPIPPPYDTCIAPTGTYELADAYHYIASPSYPAGAPILAASPGSAHMVSGITGFPNFYRAMSTWGITKGEVRFSFSYMTLGDDVEGEDWTFVGSVETRIYTGGTFTLGIQGKPAVSCTMPPLTMVIDYRTPASCFDDTIAIQTAKALPADCQDVSAGAPAATQGAAKAFLADVALVGSIHAVMSSVQPAYNESFQAAGRKGGYFNIANMAIE